VIKRYNNLSFLFFIPGVILQVAGFILNKDQPPDSFNAIALVLLIAGTVLAITGFGFYAKAKGRSPAWGIAGFLGLLGLLVLALLKDRSGDAWNT
jgi:hypothetical protein